RGTRRPPGASLRRRAGRIVRIRAGQAFDVEADGAVDALVDGALDADAPAPASIAAYVRLRLPPAGRRALVAARDFLLDYVSRINPGVALDDRAARLDARRGGIQIADGGQTGRGHPDVRGLGESRDRGRERVIVEIEVEAVRAELARKQGEARRLDVAGIATARR